MRAAEIYDYAIVRVVPRVERGEFVNAGVLLSVAASGFLGVRVAFDPARLQALDPGVDLACVRRHLDSLVAICAGGADGGPIGALPPRARFHWLTAQRSAIIQTSPVHSGRSADPAATLERLLRAMVLPPQPG